MWGYTGATFRLNFSCSGVGAKNSTASVASDPALTFFLKKVQCTSSAEVKHLFNLNKLLHGYIVVATTFAARDVGPMFWA